MGGRGGGGGLRGGSAAADGSGAYETCVRVAGGK